MPINAHASARVLSQVWKAFKQLNPGNVSVEAGRLVRIGIIGSSDIVQDATACLLKEDVAAYDRASDALILLPTPLQPAAHDLLKNCDIVLKWSGCKEALPGITANRIFEFTAPRDLDATIIDVLRTPDLKYAHLPLARAFPAFRPEVQVQIIQNVSVENAIFVTSTSLGNVIPNPLQPLASLAESVGDMVVLTANQFRMVFRLAAAWDRRLGYKEQMPEMLTVLGAAFGWRSIARELVGMIPMGGGIAPKAAIAFAGTWAVGDAIAHYYKTGRKLSREEMRQRFDSALVKGKATAEDLVEKVRQTYNKHIKRG
ncbi:MAG: hypothetical protein ABFD49_11245 [Armatimonadota bacterium]|nr:hypothetical protein [bacterium]